MIWSKNKNSYYSYNVNDNNEFYEYDDNFIFDCVCDSLAEEDWTAPKHRNKTSVLAGISRKKGGFK